MKIRANDIDLIDADLYKISIANQQMYEEKCVQSKSAGIASSFVAGDIQL